MVIAYLDDWLIWARSVPECNKATTKVLQFLNKLGFKVNLQKSRLQPSSHFDWLGIHWDLSNHKLSLPPKKVKEIASKTKNFLKNKQVSRRALERVLGLHQFASVTDLLLKAKLKDINRFWRKRATIRLRDKISKIPSILIERLRPWSKPENLSKSVPLQFPPPQVTIHTDAFLSGWGGYHKQRMFQGSLSPAMKHFHINVLEAMAVLLTLKRLSPPRSTHVRIVSDSTAVVHCINRGGSKTPNLNQVLVMIFTLVLEKNWFLSASHLAGVQNVIADSLSRTKPLESEWSLDVNSFRWISRLVPGLQVDLFATQLNHKLPYYVAPNLLWTH
ncbi:uncharacterized protein [Palaemon carinicauda]|uniref:uncharacterized protein n=1 Tax=Palaemon carinicauda TaxID=392227 RepID=UPI0035B5E4E8